MNSNYLPYGSVVTVKNVQGQMYMIVGICVRTKDKTTGKITVYDYSAVTLPKAFQGEDNLHLINKDQIDEVKFTGYFDDVIKDYYDDVEWLRGQDKNEL